MELTHRHLQLEQVTLIQQMITLSTIGVISSCYS